MWIKVFQIFFIMAAIECRDLHTTKVIMHCNICKMIQEECVDNHNILCGLKFTKDIFYFVCPETNKHFWGYSTINEEDLALLPTVAENLKEGTSNLNCDGNITKNVPLFMNNITGFTWRSSNIDNYGFQLIKYFEHLTALDIIVTNQSRNTIFTNMKQLSYLYLELEDIKLEQFLGNQMLRNLESLETLILTFTSKNETFVEVPTKLFNGLNKLKFLEIIAKKVVEIHSDHFQNIKLQKIFVEAYDTNFQWLSSRDLKDNLIVLELKISILSGWPYSKRFGPESPIHKDLSLLTNYTKLRTVQIFGNPEYLVSQLIDVQLSAYICTESEEICRFVVDVNKKKCPNNCTCDYLKVAELLRIYCDPKLMKVPELVISITGKTAFFFNDRELTELPNSTLYGYYNLSELHLINNQLSELTVAQLPPNLSYLDIRNNRLRSLDQSVLNFFLNRPGIQLQLSGNPWACNCDNLAFFSFVSQQLGYIIHDRDSLKCDLGLMAQLIKSDICGSSYKYAIIFGIGAVIVLIMTSLHYKNSIVMWLYEHNMFLNWITRLEPDAFRAKKFDAFLAFSHKNLDLVEEYVEKLENGPRDFKLCFYQRDWMVGASISQCILESIDESKRIIILMTEDFMKSPWGRFELRTAIRAASADGDKRLIVIVYPGVNIDSLDSELRIFLKYNTYLERDDPFFWRKLFYAMPHKPLRQVAYTNL